MADDNRCSLLFVRTPTLCAGLRGCQEPAVWCWPESCSFAQAADSEPCTVNRTSVICWCSSVPPTFVGRAKPSVSTWSSSTATPTPPSFSTVTSSIDAAFVSGAPNLVESMSSNATNDPGPGSGDLSGGAIAGIVVVAVLLAAALIVLIVWIIIRLKRKRKLEGKYCPAVEEQKSSAKTLPPLPQPSIEGLI